MSTIIDLIAGSGWLQAILGVVAAGIGAWFVGHRQGKQAEKDKAARERLESVTTARRVEREVDALPPDQAREELGKWSKNTPV